MILIEAWILEAPVTEAQLHREDEASSANDATGT